MTSNENGNRGDTGLLFEFFNEINIIAQLSSNRFERVLPGGLTQSQFSVLNWFVRVDDEATPGRLARAFMVTRGAMTNTLGKLEHKGLVEIEPDPSNRRRKRVTLTSAGRRVRAAAIRASDPMLDECARDLPMEDVENALTLLREVRRYLDEARD